MCERERERYTHTHKHTHTHTHMSNLQQFLGRLGLTLLDLAFLLLSLAGHFAFALLFLPAQPCALFLAEIKKNKKISKVSALGHVLQKATMRVFSEYVP